MFGQGHQKPNDCIKLKTSNSCWIWARIKKKEIKQLISIRTKKSIILNELEKGRSWIYTPYLNNI